MDNPHRNILGSTVVRTVKNMKRKIHSEEKPKPPKPVSVNDEKGLYKLTTTLEAHDEEDFKEDNNAPLSKRAKEEQLSGSKRTSIVVKSLTGISDKSDKGGSTGRTDVFNRLASKKSHSFGVKKKPEKKMPSNFFDKQYKVAIRGIIEVLLTKNKRINEFLEHRGLSKGYVTKRVVQNNHFSICFTNLLNQMFKDEEVDADLRNINPNSFVKLENFFIEKVDFELRLDELDLATKDHANNVVRLTKNRLSYLKNKLEEQEINA